MSLYRWVKILRSPRAFITQKEIAIRKLQKTVEIVRNTRRINSLVMNNPEFIRQLRIFKKYRSLVDKKTLVKINEILEKFEERRRRSRLIRKLERLRRLDPLRILKPIIYAVQDDEEIEVSVFGFSARALSSDVEISASKRTVKMPTYKFMILRLMERVTHNVYVATSAKEYNDYLEDFDEMIKEYCKERIQFKIPVTIGYEELKDKKVYLRDEEMRKAWEVYYRKLYEMENRILRKYEKLVKILSKLWR